MQSRVPRSSGIPAFGWSPLPLGSFAELELRSASRPLCIPRDAGSLPHGKRLPSEIPSEDLDPRLESFAKAGVDAPMRQAKLCEIRAPPREFAPFRFRRILRAVTIAHQARHENRQKNRRSFGRHRRPAPHGAERRRRIHALRLEHRQASRRAVHFGSAPLRRKRFWRSPMLRVRTGTGANTGCCSTSALRRYLWIHRFELTVSKVRRTRVSVSTHFEDPLYALNRHCATFSKAFFTQFIPGGVPLCRGP